MNSDFDSTETKSNQAATSPKSNREYITSFTTTTTTTQKPHIEKGVKIIRNLVEQAKTTQQPDVDSPIQSLTTIKPMITKMVEKKKSKPSTTKTPLPPNHRSESSIETTKAEVPSTTSIVRSTTMATTRARTNPVTRSPEIVKTTTAIPIGINDIQDLLENIQSTTVKKDKTTTTTTTARTKTTTDDLNFIRQVVSSTLFRFIYLYNSI